MIALIVLKLSGAERNLDICVFLQEPATERTNRDAGKHCEPAVSYRPRAFVYEKDQAAYTGQKRPGAQATSSAMANPILLIIATTLVCKTSSRLAVIRRRETRLTRGNAGIAA